MAERAPAPPVFFSALIAIWRRNYPIRELGWSGVGSGCEVLVITKNPSLLLRRLTSLCSALCLTPTLYQTKDAKEIALHLVFTPKQGNFLNRLQYDCSIYIIIFSIQVASLPTEEEHVCVRPYHWLQLTTLCGCCLMPEFF